MPVIIKGFKQLSDKVQTLFKDDFQSAELYVQIGEFTKNRIYQRTKSGKTAVNNSIVANKELSPGYIKFRQTFQKIHDVGPLFSPRRSNLTLTGQLLESLSYKIDSNKKTVTVQPSDETRSPIPQTTLKNLSKKQQPKDKTNKQVAKELADRGRVFLSFDKYMTSRIKGIVRDFLRRKIKDSFG